MSEPTKPRFEPTLGIFMLVQPMRFQNVGSNCPFVGSKLLFVGSVLVHFFEIKPI